MYLSGESRPSLAYNCGKRSGYSVYLSGESRPSLDVHRRLDGGILRGSINEIAGAASTGKTSFGLSAIAAITQSGAACAWVDCSPSSSQGRSAKCRHGRCGRLRRNHPTRVRRPVFTFHPSPFAIRGRNRFSSRCRRLLKTESSKRKLPRSHI